MFVKSSIYGGISSAQDTLALLLLRLRNKTLKDKMVVKIPKTDKPKSQELVNPITPLDYLEKEELDPKQVYRPFRKVHNRNK